MASSQIFGQGKTLEATWFAAEALQRCSICGHKHRGIWVGDGILHFLPPTQCTICKHSAQGFVPNRVLTNTPIQGCEVIDVNQFIAIMDETELSEYEDDLELMNMLIGDTIVEKFENAGFIIIRKNEHVVCILDELWAWIDSRGGRSKQSKAVTAVLLQSRKLGMDIVATMQQPRSVDLRFRQNVDLAVMAKKIRTKLPDIKDLKGNILKKRGMATTSFKYCFATDDAYDIKEMPIAVAKKLFPLYNTKKVIRRPLLLGEEEIEIVQLKMEEIRRRHIKENTEAIKRNKPIDPDSPIGKVLEIPLPTDIEDDTGENY